MHWHLTKNTEGWVASLIDSQVVAMLRGDTLEHVRQRIESYVGYQKANGRAASPVLVSEEPEAAGLVADSQVASVPVEAPVVSPAPPDVAADVTEVADAANPTPDSDSPSSAESVPDASAAPAVDPTVPAA